MKLPFRRRTPDVPRRRSIESQTISVNEPQERSYMRNRNLGNVARPADDVSSRTRAHNLTATRRRVGSIFLLIIGICIALALLIGQFTAQVTVGVASSQITRALDQKEYQKTIDSYLDHHPVERLRFFLSPQQLTTFVTSVNPEIKSVEQATNWGIGETQFVVHLRQPIAGWQINGQQYYVDADGVAFEQNYFDTPTVQIVDESGVSLQTGKTVTSTRFLSLVGKIVSLAGERGYTVTQAALPSGTTREIDVTIAQNPAKIKLSIDRGAGEQIEDMDRSLKYLASRGMTVQYVDLRVSGRAYYQ